MFFLPTNSWQGKYFPIGSHRNVFLPTNSQQGKHFPIGSHRNVFLPTNSRQGNHFPIGSHCNVFLTNLSPTTKELTKGISTLRVLYQNGISCKKSLHYQRVYLINFLYSIKGKGLSRWICYQNLTSCCPPMPTPSPPNHAPQLVVLNQVVVGGKREIARRQKRQRDGGLVPNKK